MFGGEGVWRGGVVGRSDNSIASVYSFSFSVPWGHSVIKRLGVYHFHPLVLTSYWQKGIVGTLSVEETLVPERFSLPNLSLNQDTHLGVIWMRFKSSRMETQLPREVRVTMSPLGLLPSWKENDKNRGGGIETAGRALPRLSCLLWVQIVHLSLLGCVHPAMD